MPIDIKLSLPSVVLMSRCHIVWNGEWTLDNLKMRRLRFKDPSPLSFLASANHHHHHRHEVYYRCRGFTYRLYSVPFSIFAATTAVETTEISQRYCFVELVELCWSIKFAMTFKRPWRSETKLSNYVQFSK